MKKLTAFILTFFTLATLFAAALPSLDGRAVVADKGTMPRGLFARTVGYLPGDSVTVTNPESGTSTEILVLGAIDPSEGVAILLSPEAAEALKINPGSNVQVKLTKRSGSLDENANGSAVLSNDSSDVAADEETAENSDVASEDESSPDENESEEIAEIASDEPDVPAEPVEESSAEPLPVESAPEIAEEEAAPVETEETPAEEKAPAEIASAEPVEETPAVVEEIPAENVLDETEKEKVLVEEIPAEPADTETTEPVEETPAEVAEAAEELPAENPSVEETPAEETPVETAAAPEPAEEPLPQKTPEIAKNTSGNQLQQVDVIPVEIEDDEENSEPLPVHEEELPILHDENKKETGPLQPVVVVETPSTTVSEEESEPSIEEETVEPDSSADEISEETVEAEPEMETAETENPDESFENVAEEEPSDFEETPAVAEENPSPVEEEEPLPVEEEAVAPNVEKEPEVVAEETEAASEPEEIPAPQPEPEAEVAEPVEKDAFEPIVLVPAEMNPPESSGKSSGKEEPVSEPVKEEKPVEKAAEPVKEVAPKITVSNDWRNYVVPSHKNLVKGRYYIQIASLSKETNIKNLVEKYSSKYPMVLIESTNGKSYQVMIGPLSIDEYGSVLEKMKAYGYKDAFVKHIKQLGMRIEELGIRN